MDAEWDLKDGGRSATYGWGQTQSEVHVYIRVPPDTPATAVHVRVTPHTLLVTLKGAAHCNQPCTTPACAVSVSTPEAALHQHAQPERSFVPGLTMASVVHTRAGREAALVQGGLSRAVSSDRSVWMVEGERKDTVHVYLEKVEQDVMWSAVIEGDVDAEAG
jgi:hypothetical protein